MSTKYDPSVIQEFADRLYTQAKSIVSTYTISGLILLGLMGLIATNGLGSIVGGIIGAVMGYLIGREKAFELKLKAQTALCQVQTEVNSRKFNKEI